MLSARESDGESHLEVELPVIIGTIPLRRAYGMVNKLIPATRLTRSYSGECKTFVTIKRGKMVCLPTFVNIVYTSRAMSEKKLCQKLTWGLVMKILGQGRWILHVLRPTCGPLKIVTNVECDT